MNNGTCDHTLLACVLACNQICTHYRYHACLIYLHACMYSCQSSRMSLLQASCQPANTIANAKRSATVARAAWYSINSSHAATQATPLWLRLRAWLSRLAIRNH